MKLSKPTTNIHYMKRASTMGARFLTVLVLVVSMISTTWVVPGAARSTAAESQLITLAVPFDRDQMPVASPSLPLAFIENVGQFDERAHFQVRSSNTTLYLADDALWVTVVEHPPQPDPISEMEALSVVGQETDERASQRVNLKLSFVGANPHPRLEPFDKLDTQVSFFTGSDPAQWHTGVPAWGGVRYVDLYPGVDLEIAGQNGRLAQRLVVRDHSPLQNVRLRVEGADNLTVEDDHLRFTTTLGDLSLPLLPIEGAIPETEPAVLNVERGTFEVASPFATASAFASVSAVDLPSSLTDGQVSKDCATTGLSLGDGRNLEVGAWSQYSGYDYEGLIDEFRVYDRALSADEVSMLYDPDWAYSTYLGGSGNDIGKDIAMDSAGNAYVVGQTSSTDFPTTTGAYDTAYSGGTYDVFVIKLGADGTLLYSTYLGGSSEDGGNGITVDSTGNVYVTGKTYSTNFPTTSSALDRTLNGGRDAFVAKLDASGNELLYSTYLGGNSWDYGNCIAVDDAGHAYVGGFTHGSFPITSGAAQTTFGGSGDGFAAKLSPGGDMLHYSTYLGGYSWESIDGIAIDSAGNAYLASGTHSTDFPTTPGAWDRTCDNCQTNVSTDAAVAKLNADGSEFLYSTLVGGSTTPGGEAFRDIAVDDAGNAYVVGETSSTDFPTTASALQPDFGGGDSDAVVAKLNATGSILLCSTYLGGSSGDRGLGIAVDVSGNVYVTGETDSSDFPTTPGAFEPSHNGDDDAFVVKLNPVGSGTSDLVYSTYLGGSSGDKGRGIAVGVPDNAYVTGETGSSDFPTTSGAFDTSYNGGWDAFVVNLKFPAVVQQCTIDIKPGSDPNCFNNDGHGVIPVAILSSADFDATQVDPLTVSLDGQEVRVVGKGNMQAHNEDVNGDGLDDLVMQIEDVDGTYQEGDTIATLIGETFDGTQIQGTDTICIVP